MNRFLPVLLLISLALPAYSFDFSNINVPSFKKDENQKDAKYILDVQKRDAKTRYKKKLYNRNPNGFMTVEEYENISAPKDLTQQNLEPPKIVLPSDKSYVPQPSYKIVKYNNPQGAIEISIPRDIYKYRQFNAQGIVSPDYTKMVYPSIYYYPNSASMASDLFVINLDTEKSNLDRILSANISRRNPNPIITTDSDNSVYGTFKTLTPIDFSKDGLQLLAKKKIGNSNDGIWETRLVVYDFQTHMTYDLQEIREAIIYHWKNQGLNLEEKRWDIIPMGFSEDYPNLIIVKGLAYTGSTPVNLGIWCVDSHGGQSRFITMEEGGIPIAANGYKLVKSGIVPPVVLENEQKQNRIIEKQNVKKAKAQKKKELNELKQEYKNEIKQLEAEYNFNQNEYKIRQKYTTSTGGYNEGLNKYREERAKQIEADIAKREIKIQKQEEKIKEIQAKIQAIDEKLLELENENL